MLGKITKSLEPFQEFSDSEFQQDNEEAVLKLRRMVDTLIPLHSHFLIPVGIHMTFLRHSPALQNTIHLKPEIPVAAPCVMFLGYKDKF